MLIPFSGLALGHHQFDFDLDETLFEDYEDISNAQIKLLIDLERQERMLILNFDFKGTVIVPCDRCLDAVEIPIDHQEQLIVKFGQNNNFEDEVWEISDKEHKLDLTDFIYETLVLLRPLTVMHNIADCNSDMLARIQQDSQKKPDENDKLDPRWDKLREITDNN